MIWNGRWQALVRALNLVGVVLWLLGAGETRAAQGGATLTPDRSTYLVNRDLGSDRWTIALNAVPGDPGRFVNVTGNVFHGDGSPPSFVVCQVNEGSAGRLTEPASSFSFTCKGADPCPTSARDCAANGWKLISDAVSLDAKFFLPPGGLGSPASTVAATKRGECGGLACLVEHLGDGAVLVSSRPLATGRSAAVPVRASAESSDHGATLSFDQFAYLVNKDLASERWSIALNVVPVATDQGTVARIQSVTGNVFKSDGSAPSFVYCTVRDDSQGTLENVASKFRLSCSGTDACTRTAADCAQDWQLINDDVSLPASFFLPPGGLPSSPQSDPEIIIIGRTSDPSSIVTKDFTIESESTAEKARAAAACRVGGGCLATRVGSCTSVPGRLVDIDGFGCGCQVDDVSECVTCGGGASGTCGGDCEFTVGEFTARGQCLPVTSDSGACGCYAIGAGQRQAVTGCSGPLDSACSAGSCCADDPRDGCNLSSGDVTCAGICVPSSCAPGAACGICLAQQQGSVPNPSPTPRPSGTPTPRPTPTQTSGAVCGDGNIEGDELCDPPYSVISTDRSPCSPEEGAYSLLSCCACYGELYACTDDPSSVTSDLIQAYCDIAFP